MNRQKKIWNSAFCKVLPLILVAATNAVTIPLFAQDKKIDIDIGVHKEPVWYQQPWAWIVGAAIFILLLIALLRGGKKS